MQLQHSHHKTTRTPGFTLIEMLVVVPTAIMVIVAIIGGMIILVGDALAANGRVVATYNTQDALNRIESDVRASTAFNDTLTPPSPQGRDNMAQPFSYAGTGDLIITQQATSAAPEATARNLIYYANQPASCTNTDQINANPIMRLSVIYFYDSAAQTLWRRTIVPPWVLATTNPSDPNAVCSAPWQRNSCAASTTNPICKSKDERILDHVSAFSASYYDGTNSPTTSPGNAKTVGISVTVQSLAGGTTFSQTSVLRAARQNAISQNP